MNFSWAFRVIGAPSFLPTVSEKSAYNSKLHWFAVLTAVATLGLIGIGGIVTSEGVGMAVPDWPNTYGYNMFFFPFSQWVGGILWEHSHRLFASGVGLLTMILAIWLHGRGGRKFLRFFLSPLCGVAGLVAFSLEEPRLQDAAFLLSVSGVSLIASFVWPRCQAASPRMRALGVLALVGVIAQGILGGLRVTLFADQIGIFHASLAQLFLILICSIALLSSKWWARIRAPRREELIGRRIGYGMLFLTVLVFCQLVLGASMRHQHAGLAVSRFPLIAYGEVWPATDEASLAEANRERIDHRDFNPITKNHVLIHMGHRIMALTLFTLAALFVGITVRKLPRGHWLGSALIVWFSIICLQALLGAATVWSNKAADIATLHVVFGAVTLALGGLLSIIALRLSHPVSLRASVPSEALGDLASVSNRTTPGMAHSLF